MENEEEETPPPTMLSKIKIKKTSSYKRKHESTGGKMKASHQVKKVSIGAGTWLVPGDHAAQGQEQDIVVHAHPRQQDPESCTHKFKFMFNNIYVRGVSGRIRGKKGFHPPKQSCGVEDF